MKILVRTQPISIFYVTDNDAEQARATNGAGGIGPGFVTECLGDDGFVWDTIEEFEADHEASFGSK